MFLKQITIKNFKAIETQTVELTAPQWEMVAANGTGKSTIADAIMWVMTGKLLNGNKDDMSIKNRYIDRDKHPEGLTTEVTLIFDDGTEIVKTYEENWVKTRGSEEKTLQGHTTKCIINGIDYPVTKFDDELKSLFRIKYAGKWAGNIFQLAMNVFCFGFLPWQERRQIVIDFVGEVTEQDVYSRNPQTSRLNEYMTRYKNDLENVAKVLRDKVKTLKDDETRLKAQIEVLQEYKPIEAPRFNAARQRVQIIDKEISNMRIKKNQAHETQISEQNRALSELKIRLSEQKQFDTEAYQQSIKDVTDKLRALQELKNKLQEDTYNIYGELRKVNGDISNLEIAIARKEADVVYKEQRKQTLRENWHNFRNESFEYPESNLCPNCGFDLSGEKTREDESNFNLNKVKRLTEIEIQGQALAAEITALKSEIALLKKQLDETADKVTPLKEKETALKAEYDRLSKEESTLNTSMPKPQISQETAKIAAQIAEIENKPFDYSKEEIAIDDEIGKLSMERLQLEPLIRQYEINESNQKKADGLKVELQAAIHEMAEKESLQMLLQDFIKTKLEILNERVESVFGDLKFRLVKVNLKEGSWNETCDILDGEVPFDQTNSASKIRLGIRVCEAIKKALGISLPIVIDNAEQITDHDFTALTHDQTILFTARDIHETAPDGYFPDDIKADYNSHLEEQPSLF